jgi:uncharacterized protein
MMRGLIAAACLLAALGAQAAAPRLLEWDALQPPPARPLENPFPSLSEEQRDSLRDLVRARMLAALGVPVADAGRVKQAELTRQLEAQGVAIEPLLAQREAIIEQRRREAETGVTALDGAAIELSGYLLPVGMNGDRTDEFLLVASPGSCSHAQPPPANQVVHVRAPQPLEVTAQYMPATVRGTLRVEPHSTVVFVVDGEREVGSTYALHHAVVTLHLPAGR